MGRPLTEGELKLATDIFKNSVDLPRVRIHDAKFVFFQPNNSGMTPNGQIYVAGVYSQDYASESPTRQAFFIHEMVHVWQHQNGVLAAGVIGSAILEIIGRAGDYEAAYPYALEAAKDLTDYGIEQQASIIEDYFRLTRLDLQPRRAIAPPASTGDPSLVAAPDQALFESVLRRFLSDPTYGQQPRRRARAPAR